MNVASAIAFDSAEREYNNAWSAPSSTRFELPPSAHLHSLCGFAGPLMGPNDPARWLHAVLSVIIAAGMDHAAGRTRPRGRFVSDARQTIYFLGRPQMVEETGQALVASPFQPLFHVRHGAGGSERAPLNLWSIVLLTNAPETRYCEPFEQMVRAGLLPAFIGIYIERDLKLKLSRIRP